MQYWRNVKFRQCIAKWRQNWRFASPHGICSLIFAESPISGPHPKANRNYLRSFFLDTCCLVTAIFSH